MTKSNETSSSNNQQQQQQQEEEDPKKGTPPKIISKLANRISVFESFFVLAIRLLP